MDIYTLSEEQLKNIINAIKEEGFETDVWCDCGDFEYQLEDSLYLCIDRGCRKSSSCNNHAWQLSNCYLVKDSFKDKEGLFPILPEEQNQIILQEAREKSITEIGYDENWNRISNREEKDYFDSVIFDSCNFKNTNGMLKNIDELIAQNHCTLSEEESKKLIQASKLIEDVFKNNPELLNKLPSLDTLMEIKFDKTEDK